MKDIVILGAVRTAIGAFGKSLQEISAAQLGEIVVREAFTPREDQGGSLTVTPLNWLVISLCGVGVVALGVLPGLLRII